MIDRLTLGASANMRQSGSVVWITKNADYPVIGSGH